MGDRRRLWRWVHRYAPAEVAATAGALLGALVGIRLAGPVGAAVGGDLGEGLAFSAVVVARELRAERSAGPNSLSRSASRWRMLLRRVADRSARSSRATTTA